jgi:short-subunit dehydrogenase
VALAEELASGGTNLVLTARRKDRLDALAQRLSSSCKIQTEVFPADLADPAAPEKIFAFTKKKESQSICSSTMPAMASTANFHPLTNSAFSTWSR